MKKSPRPSALADRLHRGFVWCMLGLTAYGFYIGGVRVYQYMTVTRPQRIEAKDKLIKDEEELQS